MKYISMTILALLALAGFSLGMFALFDSPVVILEKSPEPSIEFVELSDDKSCDRKLSTQIGRLKMQQHSCQSHADCQLKDWGGGCGNYIINNDNALRVDTLTKAYFEACIYQAQPVCMMAYDPYQYKAMCIDNYCKKAKMIDPEVEVKKYLETGVMFR